MKAQLGPSDMRLPIQYAFSYPERWEPPAPRVDWRTVSDLVFEAPDEETFGCLALAREAGRRGGTLPCRENRCGFLDIEACVAHVMERSEVVPVESLGQLVDIDMRSRELAGRFLSRCVR